MKIIDRATEFDLQNEKDKVIHGHTSIVLKNVKTGLVERVESDNTFQSAVLSNYMRGLGEANNNPFNNTTFAESKPWENLVGGLFLFRDTITEGTEFMPAGNLMVGNGSYGVSNGEIATDPTEMGSFNATESSASGSAITQVYDFTTAQANGTIGCVCLTSQTGGYIGYGNASGKQKATKYDLYKNQSYRTLTQYNERISARFIIGNYSYEFNISSGIMTCRKTKTTITQGSVFSGFYTDLTFDLSVIGNPLSLTGAGCRAFRNGTKIAIMPKYEQRNIANGDTAYYYEFDPANDSLTLKSFTNSTGGVILVVDYYNYFGNISYGTRCAFENGNIFVWNQTTSKVNVIRLSDSTTIAELENISIGGGGDDGVNMVMQMPGGLALVGNTQARIWDGADIRPINANTVTGEPSFDSVSGALATFSNTPILYKNPLYLATINNLNSAVTKTAAKTMKITYTLTEA